MFRAGRCVERKHITTASIAHSPDLLIPVARPCNSPDLATLTRRFPAHVPWPSLISVVRPIGRTTEILQGPRDISREQMRWKKYCREVRSLCSSKFWKFFLPMHTFSRSAIDTALRCARNTFSACHQFHGFPTTTRTLFRKMRDKVLQIRVCPH